jgi:ribosome-associated toxin RatA of RatAB toxin-antitoxin module
VIAELAAAIALAAPLAAAAPLQLEVQRDGDRFEIHAAVSFAAPPRLVWDTLTDYERLRDFMPGVSSSRVIERDGNRLTVEHHGEFDLLFFARPVRVRLAVEHRPFTTIVARSLPQLADGSPPTLRDFVGRYELAVVRDGEVRLAYDARFELAEPLPPVIGALFGTMAMRSAIRADFDALIREIERRRAAVAPIERGR